MHFLSPNSPLGRWLTFLLDALLISVAWAVCSLSIITLGASTAALNVVAHNWMKDRSDCSLRYFFRGFKDNWKGGTGVWLLLLIPLAFVLFTVNAAFFSELETTSTVMWLAGISAAVWLAVAIYAFALQAVFENAPFRTVMNALRIAVSHFGTTLILVAIFAAAILATYLLPIGAVFYTPLCVFLTARPIWNVFKKVMAMPDVTVTGADEFEDEGE